MSRNKYNGKIMSCANSDLGIGSSGSHYVYVKKTKDKEKFDVHTITSIESPTMDQKHTIPLVINKHGKTVYLDAKKLKAMRNGNLYPIPFYQSNFAKWSGITHAPITGIDKSKLSQTRKRIWSRHKFIVGKIYK